MTDDSSNLGITETITYEMVTDNDTLNSLCSQWRQCPFLAMDTEFIRTTTFFPHVGLIQINAGSDANYLIDPLPIDDWDAFKALMLDTAVVKIFHSCSEDIQVFMAAMQLVPTPVFDTQIAAAFLNTGFGISYQNLVGYYLNIDLPKGETRSDWLQRPLTETQCQYAALDVACLTEIYLAQQSELARTSRLPWLQEECDLLLQQYRQEQQQDFSLFYQNIKGAWQLNRKQLATLKELAQWRELRARKRDKPRNWIIRDNQLIDIARQAPADMEALEQLEGISKNFLRHEGHELLDLVTKGEALPENDCPELLPRPLDGKSKSRLKKGQQFVEHKASELAIPVEILARKRWLISLLQDMMVGRKTDSIPALPAELQGWRKSMLLPGLLEAMR